MDLVGIRYDWLWMWLHRGYGGGEIRNTQLKKLVLDDNELEEIIYMIVLSTYTMHSYN